jgi:hypothetical protein
MSEDNTWPDPARPGVPLNPERDGWHWLLAMYYDDPIGPPISCFWYAEHQSWPRLQDKPGNQPVSRGFCYLGPAFTPAEVDARVKEARRDAREKVARYHDLMAKMAGSSSELQRRSLWVHSESAKDIRSGIDIRVLGEKE